ncbi:MAG: hypothetical protein OEX19_14245 [Gammaproteobacteria bacterium]|nr:hypothetical protein [Gammaproteobacteria bacterium]
MNKLLASLILMLLPVYNTCAETLRFSYDLVVGKTFYIQEESDYDTIAKFYLDNNELKLFYVIFYKGKLDETDTLNASINTDGRISYTVVNRPTELELIEAGTKKYLVKEYHSKKHINTLVLQFKKPERFAHIKGVQK